MQKALGKVVAYVVEGNAWTKLTNPAVVRGRTVFPLKEADKQRLGIRFDYDGEATRNGTLCHKYQMQPNAGDDIPASIKRWRDKKGGTHEVMADVYVKKEGTKDDVKKALEEAMAKVQGV
ncbi:hypothetical protein BGW80DRAFT_252442 [Lactifluus volemus]|nr:hypothetical protein BGW80DRAFT_252442 [Lactifluus volemus]